MTKSRNASLMAAAFVAFLPVAAQAQSQQPALPEGEAKVLVDGLCTMCHRTNMITASMGYTRDGWKELMGTMLDLSGNADMQDKLVDYLATHFPPNTRRAPTLVPGSVQISLKEWTMPQLGQRSRDPVQAEDGLIWYAGQFGNLMGSINPKTSEIKEYPLPPDARPHTVEIDAKGNIWYTGNTNGTVGYLDPKTGKITVFKMPDPKAKDPHTLVFDSKGIGWFTLQNSNMVGRIDPESGNIKLVTLKTPNAKPYGIKIDADGNPWFSCNGHPCLYKINAANFELTEVKLPLPGTTVRRLDIAADGIIWYVNSGLGRLGRYDPKTGEIKEWPSPSGPKSHPYAIVVVDGIVWYNESGMRPDPLVRFDPKTETFQSWAIPSGNIYAGIIRHMRAARDGSLLIHQSSTNRIIQVTVPRRRCKPLMLRTGKEHLETLRDGRVVYVGGERIDDVTRHPAFRGAAETVAGIYDLKADPAHRDAMTFEEDGGRHSIYFLRPRTRDDLQRRMEGHRKIAEFTYGMFGRSPDHVASFVTGMAMKPDALPAPHAFAENLQNYYRHIRDHDTYVVYAVVPPQAARNPEFYQKQNIPVPTLRVVREDDDGVVISGMKMLATGALYANEIWIGNVIPLAPDQKKEAITCSIPCNAPGLTLWSRKPAAAGLTSEFDSPLAWRYDEGDSMLMCENVRVPWERVFVHDDALLSRDIYIKTPSHCFGNHQSNVRYWSKMRLLLGLCSRIAQTSGADQVPAVREKLGEMAAIEATIGGMINGQINAFENWPDGYVCFNRRFMYAGLEWCTQNYSRFIDELRTLCGGSVFQMPADISVLDDPELAKQFSTFWQTPQADALTRMKLYKLAWDLTGSEFAGRHLQYEKFYAGASFIIRNHSYRETDWGAFNALVDDVMANYDAPKAGKRAAAK